MKDWVGFHRIQRLRPHNPDNGVKLIPPDARSGLRIICNIIRYKLTPLLRETCGELSARFSADQPPHSCAMLQA